MKTQILSSNHSDFLYNLLRPEGSSATCFFCSEKGRLFGAAKALFWVLTAVLLTGVLDRLG